MNELKAKKLQVLFEEISKVCCVNSSLGFFIDDDTVTLTCNNVDDKDLFRLAGLMITQISNKYEIAPEKVLGALLAHIEEDIKSNKSTWENRKI